MKSAAAAAFLALTPLMGTWTGQQSCERNKAQVTVTVSSRTATATFEAKFPEQTVSGVAALKPGKKPGTFNFSLPLSFLPSPFNAGSVTGVLLVTKDGKSYSFKTDPMPLGMVISGTGNLSGDGNSGMYRASITMPTYNDKCRGTLRKKERMTMAANEVTTASGLKYTDSVVGTGESPKKGQLVTVHYTGTLTDGSKFDSSVDRKQPFSFQIGVGRVIKGWDEGVMTMKVGGKRRLVIPATLGYGAHGAGNVIPPNATLIFDVELLGLQ